jgi:hypothetical protein
MKDKESKILELPNDNTMKRTVCSDNTFKRNSKKVFFPAFGKVSLHEQMKLRSLFNNTKIPRKMYVWIVWELN